MSGSLQQLRTFVVGKGDVARLKVEGGGDHRRAQRELAVTFFLGDGLRDVLPWLQQYGVALFLNVGVRTGIYSHAHNRWRAEAQLCGVSVDNAADAGKDFTFGSKSTKRIVFCFVISLICLGIAFLTRKDKTFSSMSKRKAGNNEWISFRSLPVTLT